MEYSEYSENTTRMITLNGDLSHNSWEQFRPLLQESLMGKVTRVHINLEGIRHVDCAGMSLLELLQLTLKSKGGSLVLVNLPAQLKADLKDFQFPFDEAL